MAKMDPHLKRAKDLGASDIHFSAGVSIGFRIDGDLKMMTDEKPFSAKELETILFEFLTEEEKEKVQKNKNLDRSYLVENIGNYRVNIFYTTRGIAAVFRIIPQEVPSLADVGAPKAFQELASQSKGLVLVTGPTGSGKSTTLAAMIDFINRNNRSHILTIEDPVEFIHQSKMSLINQREIGNSSLSFSESLKYALREDPDVILVGELRDLETISLALTAAETGHLVLGTLHTRGAAASIDRIIDCFPASQQAMIRTMLSESLIGVISQCLLKKSTGRGRVAAFEVLKVNHAIANLIREGKTYQVPSIMQTNKKEGMLLLDSSIAELARSGQISFDEAAMYIEDISYLKNVPQSSEPSISALTATHTSQTFTRKENVAQNLKVITPMIDETSDPGEVDSLWDVSAPDLNKEDSEAKGAPPPLPKKAKL